MNTPFRVGQGFDLHPWAPDRRLVLGGVEIPHEQGLLGHSDADALTHAIIDALLGALGLGDIGQHFPDTDPAYQDADSQQLLTETQRMITQEGWQVGNIDCTLVSDAPKMRPHIQAMQTQLGATLQIEPGCISIKATRTEHVLFDPQKGLLAMATALLYRHPEEFLKMP